MLSGAESQCDVEVWDTFALPFIVGHGESQTESHYNPDGNCLRLCVCVHARYSAWRNSRSSLGGPSRFFPMCLPAVPFSLSLFFSFSLCIALLCHCSLPLCVPVTRRPLVAPFPTTTATVSFVSVCLSVYLPACLPVCCCCSCPYHCCGSQPQLLQAS